MNPQDLIGSRRKFLKIASLGITIGAVPGLLSLTKLARGRSLFHDSSPIQSASDHTLQESFVGDNPSRAHAILWDKDAYLARKGGLPAVTEMASVVVVGGGIAGLSAAYNLRDLKPIVLEQSAQFGGNAKGENWEGLKYSIGSAYIPRPDPKSTLGGFLNELGLLSQLRHEDSEDEAVLLSTPTGRKIVTPFWDGATDPAHAEQFKRVRAELIRIENEEYPAIPAKSAAAIKHLHALDRFSFSEWLKTHLGEIHPHIEELFNEYCWDALGGSMQELSAAQVLNFLTADLAGGISALPGGNAAIAETIYKKLESTSLRANALVVDMRIVKDRVHVTYEDNSGKLHTIAARSCVVSAPKFVAKAFIHNLPKAQEHAIARIKYRAFLVANVMIREHMTTEHYGVFSLKNKIPKNEKQDDAQRAFTSVIFGNWASHDRSQNSVLTLYKGFPFDSGRSQLFKKNAFAEMKAKFTAEIPGLLSGLRISQGAMTGLRIARWGHALPVAAKGLLADGTLERASQPIGGRIFFGQQDNWANPCIESAITSALTAATAARAVST